MVETERSKSERAWRDHQARVEGPDDHWNSSSDWVGLFFDNPSKRVTPKCKTLSGYSCRSAITGSTLIALRPGK
jgi:hypothetical protein